MRFNVYPLYEIHEKEEHRNMSGSEKFRVFCDVGADDRYLLDQYVFDSLLEKRTWETPAVQPTGNMPPDGNVQEKDGLRLTVNFSCQNGAAAYCCTLENIGSSTRMLNGLAFTVRLGGDVLADFPLNTPHGIIDTRTLAPGQTIQGGLVSPCIHVKAGAADYNLLFLDEVEKWSLAVYKAADEARAVFIPAVECDLKPGEKITCGTLYIQQPEGDPYLAIRDFFSGLGYQPAQDGYQGGVMYSCHPNGTMDGMMDHEPQGPGMRKFAEYLPVLKDMGVDHIWILPIFEHTGRGVYHTSDQFLIDPRYGGDEAVRYYVDQAHALGMTVLFDYVPHGPAIGDPLYDQHPEWCSMRRDGAPQEEWDCVSFDMTLPAYREYTTGLIKNHVDRFGIDGARIDCAMGGLTNWRPQGGNRPSASNLHGGVCITKAIFDGFRSYDKKTLVLPENFNPVPCYYPVTDVFYGMNFYRLLVELDQQYREDPVSYVRELTRWLIIEHKAMPEGLGRLRFLGNHDTVSWVWQASRAVDWYGLERAKALFALIFLIDGLPMLYMGDEDPVLACKKGPVLRDFFRELIALRKSTVGDSRDIVHLDTGCGVFACKRRNGEKTYLVAINLSSLEETVHLEGKTVTLAPWQWRVEAL